MIYVQFDESEQEVIAVFGKPQDIEVYKNQGQVERDDPRLIEYWQKIPQELLPRN